MRVLPTGALEVQQGVTEGFTILRCRLRPIAPNRIPCITETFLIRVSILRDDRRDSLRVANCKPKAHGCPVVKNIKRVTHQADRLSIGFDNLREVVKGIIELRLGGDCEKPKPGRSGATMWKRSTSNGIRLRNMWDELGKPCSRSRVASSGLPASR